MSSTIRKRVGKTGKVSYQAQVFSGKNAFVGSKTFDRRKDAVAWISEKQSELKAGVDLTSSRTLVGNALDAWEDLLPGQIAESTVKYYQSVMRIHAPQWLKDKKLCDVSVSDMQNVLNDIDLSIGSKQRIRTAFMSFFTWCVNNGYLAKSPMKGTRLPRADNSEMKMNPFTWDQLDSLVDVIREDSDPFLADVILILGYTGLRWGEIRVLKVRDVQLEPVMRFLVRASQTEGMQIKYPKSGKARHVPVADKIRPIVLGHMKGKGPDELVFTTRSGAKLNKGNIKRDTHWKALSHGRRLHDLRHTAATEWLRHGIDVLTVKEWLGHSSLAMTQRYVHYLGTDADIAAIEKLNQ